MAEQAHKLPSFFDRQLADDIRGLAADYGVDDETEGVALCYGSMAWPDGSPEADIDMLIVEDPTETYTGEDRAAFTAGLIAVHQRTGRRLDEEVPYANKLFYSRAEIDAAFRHDMFPIDHSGHITIPDLSGMRKGDPYFSGRDMKLRLALNAFTSAHIFIAGSPATYRELSSGAAHSLNSLAQKLAATAGVVLESPDRARDLLVGPPGIDFKDYLGYRPDDPVFRAALAGTFR